MKRSGTIALVDGTEPVAVTPTGEVAQTEPMDEFWFKRRVLELIYDVGRLKEEVAQLKDERAGV